jgi:hypothetical protein
VSGLETPSTGDMIASTIDCCVSGRKERPYIQTTPCWNGSVSRDFGESPATISCSFKTGDTGSAQLRPIEPTMRSHSGHDTRYISHALSHSCSHGWRLAWRSGADHPATWRTVSGTVASAHTTNDGIMVTSWCTVACSQTDKVRQPIHHTGDFVKVRRAMSVATISFVRALTVT